MSIIVVSLARRAAEQALRPEDQHQNHDRVDDEAADLDLISGRVDLVFADSVVIDEFLASEDGAGFAVVGEPVFDTQYLGEGAGIGIRKGDEALKAKFDTALAALIASGTYKTINDKYMPTDIAPPK